MKSKRNKKPLPRQEDLVSLFNFNPNPVVGIDNLGRVAFANPASKKALQKSAAGFDPAFFVPRDIKVILRGLKKDKKRQFRREITVGENIFSQTLQYCPELKLLLLFATDITQCLKTKKALSEIKQKLEKRLRKSVKLNELNRSIMDNAPISIITTDNKGNIISKNKYYENFSRIDRKRNGNIFKGEFFIREKLVDDYRKLLTHGITVRRENCYEQNKEGEDKYLKIMAVPLKDRKGKIKGALSMAIDNTETILLQNNLLESYNHAGVVNRRVALLRDMDKLFEALSDRKKVVAESVLSLLANTFAATFALLFAVESEGDSELQSLCSVGIKKQRKNNIKIIEQNVSAILSELKDDKLPIKGFFSDFKFISPELETKAEYFRILPVVWENKLRAIIFLGQAEKNELDSQEAEFLEVFFSHASMLLVQAKLLT